VQQDNRIQRDNENISKSFSAFTERFGG